MADETTRTELDEATAETEIACGFYDDGRNAEGDRRLAIAGVRAQIASAEQLRRIADLMDGTTDAPGLIGITGHVTTGAP